MQFADKKERPGWGHEVLLKAAEVQTIELSPESHFFTEVTEGFTGYKGDGGKRWPHHSSLLKPTVPSQQHRLHHELKLYKTDHVSQSISNVQH